MPHELQVAALRPGDMEVCSMIGTMTARSAQPGKWRRQALPGTMWSAHLHVCSMSARGVMIPATSSMSMHRCMDTLEFEPRAFRMRSGCDTTTPCAQLMPRLRPKIRASLTEHGLQTGPS